MNHFPTMKDVEELINKEKEQKKSENAPQHMEFSINNHLSEDERLKEVTDDIAKEYPELPRDLRRRIAALEEPIKGCHEDYDMFYKDELRIYRLFNILQILHDSCHDLANKYGTNANYFINIYTKSFKDIKESYKTFLKNFSYSNPGEQKVSKIMYLLKEFHQDSEIIIPEF